MNENDKTFLCQRKQKKLHARRDMKALINQNCKLYQLLFKETPKCNIYIYI